MHVEASDAKVVVDQAHGCNGSAANAAKSKGSNASAMHMEAMPVKTLVKAHGSGNGGASTSSACMLEDEFVPVKKGICDGANIMEGIDLEALSASTASLSAWAESFAAKHSNAVATHEDESIG